MDAFYLFGQGVFLVALAYGCYFHLKYRHLGDSKGIEREFGVNPGFASPSGRYEPMQDRTTGAEIGCQC